MGNKAKQNIPLKQQLSNIVDNMPLGLVTVSENLTVETINAKAVKLLGFPESQTADLIGVDYTQALANIGDLFNKFNALMLTKRRRKFDLLNIKTKSHKLNIKCRSMRNGTLITLEDIAENNDLQYKASHDPLTQLTNRQSFEEKLEPALQKALRHNIDSAVVFIDIDRFKPVNDTAGHAAGDDLLKRIATILQSRVREGDTLARIGGDEFAILLENCSLLIAEEVSERIRKDIETTIFSYADKIFNITISAGITPVNGAYKDTSTLMKAADAACQSSKNQGRNHIHVINQKEGEFEAHIKEVAWLDEINKALAHDSFELYAQKITALDTGESTDHYELLLRLKNEDGSITPPGIFIPSAERYELMPKIDRWVLLNAFSAIKSSEFYSINLSGQTVSDIKLVDYIGVLQHKYKVDPHHITFEITETAAIHNLDSTTSFIQQLKQQGYHFSLDDFGTGLSSFSYLKNMAVDYLKIDGVFVKNIDNDETSYTIVKSINDVGHSMGLKTVAEFVENVAILDKLKEIGVDFAQGYHIHKPQPLFEIINTKIISADKSAE